MSNVKLTFIDNCSSRFLFNIVKYLTDKMNLDRDAPSTDEYFVTAVQIFDYCSGENSGTLRVDALMDKFAPFVKTSKTEFNYLKSLLDPDQSNPEINVTKLASALHKYSESQKTKVDLDESFNLKNAQTPQDSDSGISSDGFQLLEELQCELREKTHLAHQLRSQLDFTDRQHEEALATLTAERDSLRAHLNMLREENMTLTHVRRDYEEACDRLSGSEQALSDARRELESYRKRDRTMQEEVVILETERLTLQELLTKSKDECHRINEMYAARQSALLEENETLKTEHADLGARLQDQDEFMQQMIKEKVLLEMELKDMLNKSNQTHLRFDRSIDVSYTDDQMLTALDSLNADSRFAQENQLLDEESFLNTLKEDQGRATNMSLFDEIRVSFSNMSRLNITDINDSHCDKCMDNLDSSFTTTGTQTDKGYNEKGLCNNSNVRLCCNCSKDMHDENVNLETTVNMSWISIGVQADVPLNFQTHNESKICNLISTETQTKETGQYTNNNHVANCGDCLKCLDCDKNNKYKTKLEWDLKHSHCAIAELQVDLNKYEQNLNKLQSFLDEGNEKNNLLQNVVQNLQTKLCVLEAACGDQKNRIDDLYRDTNCAECQTECEQMSVSTQVDVPCAACEKRNAVAPHRLRRYLWEPLKCLFQMFALVCFLCAISVLYGVTRRWNARCERDTATVPWRWFDAQDILDLLLRIEYVSDIPM